MERFLSFSRRQAKWLLFFQNLLFMSKWLLAGIWGLVSGSALIIGASVGYYANINGRWIAAIMSFGSGVLISALSFDLMDEAYRTGGFDSTSIGFVAGAVVYTAANILLAKKGARHR